MMAPTACSLLGAYRAEAVGSSNLTRGPHQIAAEELESTIMLAEAAMNNERD